jgi:hypothetical protein
MPRNLNNADTAIVARKADGNPEGKGLNGLLLDLRRSEPRGVVAKPHRQVLAELFTSMLILSATFKYRPAVGAANYLYWLDGEWSLSLIGPGEWSAERREAFVGTCRLQRDMTWTIDPSRRVAEAGHVVCEALGRYYDAFARMLDTHLPLEDILPFCAGKLPYYQRLYANALSRSLSAAVTVGNQAATSSREWRALLPGQGSPLLAFGS